MNIRPLIPLETPLSGKSLIEASAGTGKTYTIAALYLRLILEEECTVQQILVVTFTNAATKELRDRLRKRLAQAYDKFSGIDTEKDLFLDKLFEQTVDHAAAAKRLLVALRNFDECAVFTIHGFCGLLLREAALESGLPLEQEMQMDDSELKQRIADDFWRRRFGERPSALLALFRHRNLSPDDLLADVETAVFKPYLKVYAGEMPDSCETVVEDISGQFQRLRCVWSEEREEICRLLVAREGLLKRVYKSNWVNSWLGKLGNYLAEHQFGQLPKDKGEFDKWVTRLQASSLLEHAENGKAPPSHAFFEHWERFVQIYERFSECIEALHNQLRHDLLLELRSTLAAEKKKTGVMTPDDILLGLHEALDGDAAGALVKQARKRFPVALIDEFQDTDPVQYAIFSKLYGADSSRVFYVGDPKQAIYGFRGADVFTYLKARDQVATESGNLWTLDTNWRSTEGVVNAVNGLFEGHDRPFWLKDMVYHPVKPSGKEGFSSLEDDRGSFRLLTLDADDAVGSTLAKADIAEAIADDIAGLLLRAREENWLLDERTFNGGDIAVLVRSHSQGNLIKVALGRRGIACVQASKNSVFESEQSEQMAILMTAIAHGNNEAEIRLALATDLFSLSAGDIAAMVDDTDAWDGWLERFNHWRQLWLTRGFTVMFREVLQRAEIYRRLLALTDGERRLTDLLHLAELLNHEALQQSLGMESLLRWLHRARECAGKERNTPDERKLRLESDENLVTIATIHASKGLEYSVVYCPYLWDSNSKKGNVRPFMFHNQDEDNQPSLELGSELRERWLAMKKEEDFADDLRLLYVAVTRAKQHCVIVTGNINGSETGGLAWLLHGRDLGELSLADAQAEIKKRMKQSAAPTNLSPAIRRELMILLDTPQQFRAEEPTSSGKPRRFARKLGEPSRITSYTGLISGQHTEQPDYDFFAQHDEDDVLRGAQAGSCLHAVLEHLVFTRPLAEQAEMVSVTLAQFGFDATLVERVVIWMQDVLDTPLFSGADFSLAKLADDDRLNEMEFYFPVAGLNADSLKIVLNKHLPAADFSEAIKRLNFQTVNGYLKGFIDLVYRRDGRYFLVDYKSNWLAREPLDYSTERMRQAIASEHYYLQYLIYTVALHRYLQRRLADYDYERDFGGVQYLFLRGMRPDSIDTGVYFHWPPLALIEELEEWLG